MKKISFFPVFSSGLDPNSIGSVNPDPGRPKRPQKGEKSHVCEEVFDLTKKFSLNFYKYKSRFRIKIFLDL